MKGPQKISNQNQTSLSRRKQITCCLVLIAFIVATTAMFVVALKHHNNNNTKSNIFQELSNILSSTHDHHHHHHHHHPDESVVDNAQQKGLTTKSNNNKNDIKTTLSSAMLKTYIRANNMRAYHLDLHSYRPSAKFVGDPEFVDSENIEHKDRCSRHLRQYHKQLRSFYELDPVLAKNSLDSIKLADSFGRPEAGLLSGHQFWLGDYDNCIDFSTVDQTSPNERIHSQYCLGITQFPNWNPQDSKTSIKVGLCLPETCTSSMLNENSDLFNNVELMMKYQFQAINTGSGISTSPYSKLKLRQVYCLPHETSEIRKYSFSAMCFLALIGTFFIGCLAATTIDYLETKAIEQQDKQLLLNELLLKRQHEQANKTWRTIVIESFSLIRNVEKFFHIREETPSSQATIKAMIVDGAGIADNTNDEYDRNTFLNSITGLKCIGLCWIIAAHTFLVAPITSKNIIDSDRLTKTYLADIYLTAHLMVDTFFCLSGMLAAYFIFKEGIDKIKTKHWLIMTVHRYWRLTPIYLLCYWFTKNVGFLLNSGPMWDYMTSETSPRLNCNRESWWEAILQLSDFKSPKEHCVPFAWFIANGIKFWMVTPIFVILIHKSIRRGYMFTMITILANIILVGTLAMRSNVDMKSVIEFKPESADNMLNNMGEIYTRPYSRIGAYLIGLLAGHLMFLIDTNQLKVKLSQNTNALIWTLFSIVVLLLTFILKIANKMELDESAIPIVFGICSALVRPLWSLCTCWLVFALAHGHLKGLANFLSAKCWRILVKLSFCAYLAQGEVIAQLYLSTSSANSYTYTDMFSRPIVTIVLTIVVSFIMVLILEYPLVGIEQLILPKRHKKASPIQEGASNKTTTTITTNVITTTTMIGAPHQQCHNNVEKLKSC